MLSSVDEAVQPLRNEFENDTEVKNIKRENDYIDDKAVNIYILNILILLND